MSVVRVANKQLLATLTTEEAETEPDHEQESSSREREGPLPLSLLGLMIKKGMTTDQRGLNPALATTFSPGVMRKIQRQDVRLRTMSDFKIRRTKRSLKTSPDKLQNDKNSKNLKPITKPLLTRKLTQDLETIQVKAPAKLNADQIQKQMVRYRLRLNARVGKVLKKKYVATWQRLCL